MQLSPEITSMQIKMLRVKKNSTGLSNRINSVTYNLLEVDKKYMQKQNSS